MQSTHGLIAIARSSYFAVTGNITARKAIKHFCVNPVQECCLRTVVIPAFNWLSDQ